MILTHLSLENFKNFRQKEIDFSRGINVLQGPNGSGKTSALEAVEFALFGSVTGRGGLEPLIRLGETLAIVSLTFEVEQDSQKRTLTVLRSIGKGETGASTIKTQLTSKGIEISSRKMQVDAQLIKLVGLSHASYGNSCYIRQGEIRSLLEAGKEREREIDRMIGLGVFEDAWRDLRKTESELERETSAANEELITAKAEVESLLSVSEELSKRMEEKVRLEDQIRRAQKAPGDLPGPELSVETNTHPIQVERDKAAQSQKIQGLEEQLLQIQRRIESTNDRLLEMEAEILRREKRTESLADEKQNLEDRVTKIEEETKGLRESLKEVGSEVLRLEADLEVQKSLITSFSQMEARGELVCPVCGSDLTPEHARSARRSLDGRVRELQEAIERKRLDLRRFEQSADATSSRSARLQSQLEEIGKEISEAEAQNAALRVSKEELQADLGVDLQRKRELESAIERERGVLRHLEEALPQGKALGVENHLTESRAKYLADKRMLQRLEEEIPQLMERLGEEQMKRKRLEEAEKRHSELSRRLQRIRDLRWAFNNIGPFARRKILPSVESRTRELFRKIYSGSFIEDVELGQDYDISAKTRHGIPIPSRLLSVGERVIAGLALRISLSQISVTFTGASEGVTKGAPGFLILDEPTEYLDESNVKTLATALAELEALGQIIVVTHDRELVEGMAERSAINRILLPRAVSP